MVYESMQFGLDIVNIHRSEVLGPPLFGLYPNGLFMIGLSPFGLPMMFGLSPFGLF